jgi:DedD protein
MALFKFRNAGDDHPAPPKQPESVEGMRKRALFRLIGAAVLVLAGVIGFPLLFDSQPRPIAVDIPIEIPDKSKVKPQAMPGVSAEPAAPAKPAAAVESAPTAAPAAAPTTLPVQQEAAITPKLEEIVPATPARQAQTATKSIAKPESKPESKPEPKPATKPVANAADAAKAQALLEGKTLDQPAAASGGRFVVQVGAFSDAARAKEARSKVERAGLKTYTQVVETKDGQRTRVRVGPFADKAEAEAAAQKIKTLDLPAAVLTL